MSNAVLSDHSRKFQNLRFVYPVVSRRSRGLSIGINVNPDKVCNFACPYCQVNRTGQPPSSDVNMDELLSELSFLMNLARNGEIWSTDRFRHTPTEYRRVNDIAFAGDGEPTTWSRLGEALSAISRLKNQFSLEEVKTIVLTNATLLGRKDVLDRLSKLKDGPYEIWAKLDAGTQEYFEYISGTKHKLDSICENIVTAGKQFELTIQSLFPTVNGDGPSNEEIAAFVARINDLTTRGSNLRLVQFYTTARRPSEDVIGMIDDTEMDRLGSIIRGRIDVPLEVYYGRQWDA
ncbi:MAG: radical SAM protein [Planctomycetota bacterium]|jgi:wyosine [tRNA(Phe)-imidazoG37] synthetase (radical SAM superfamily)